MLRIFFFFLIVLTLAFGFSWLADRPGEVELLWQGKVYNARLIVVTTAIVALIATIMIAWWILRSILDSPRIVQRFFRRRRRDQGYAALTKGLIAANSGDALTARKQTRESVRLLGRGPLVDLLDAQSSLLEGKRDDAKTRFEAMLENDETKLVGLRGLFVEAERQGAIEAARHYADEAHKMAPSVKWAGNAKLRYASRDGDWEGALATLEKNRNAGVITKQDAKRHRAVLLTAQAMSEEQANPAKAAKLAREAHRLAPDLVPAAVIGAKALMRNNDLGRAAGIIEKVWKTTPHPELADAYVHLRIGDSAADRLKRAIKLSKIKPNHVEGSIAIAQAAIEAQDWKLARDTLRGILTTTPTERACLLMADVEEGEHGDRGRMRDWLSRAVRAPRDAAWTADGYVSENWLPFSPVTGRIDAFEWKVPVEEIGASLDVQLEAQGMEELIAELPAPAQPQSETAAETAADAVSGAVGGVVAGARMTEDIATNSNGTGQSVPTENEEVQASQKSNEAEGGKPVAPMPPADASEAQTPPEGRPQSASENSEQAISETAAGDVIEGTVVAKAESNGPSPEAPIEGENRKNDEKPVPARTTDTSLKTGSTAQRFEQGHAPDDPGVKEGEEPKERKKRFGLF